MRTCGSLGGKGATGENLLRFAPDEAEAAQVLSEKAARGPGPVTAEGSQGHLVGQSQSWEGNGSLLESSLATRPGGGVTLIAD